MKLSILHEDAPLWTSVWPEFVKNFLEEAKKRGFNAEFAGESPSGGEWIHGEKSYTGDPYWYSFGICYHSARTPVMHQKPRVDGNHRESIFYTAHFTHLDPKLGDIGKVSQNIEIDGTTDVSEVYATLVNILDTGDKFGGTQKLGPYEIVPKLMKALSETGRITTTPSIHDEEFRGNFKTNELWHIGVEDEITIHGYGSIDGPHVYLDEVVISYRIGDYDTNTVELPMYSSMTEEDLIDMVVNMVEKIRRSGSYSYHEKFE